jgi:hypothetical protein
MKPVTGGFAGGGINGSWRAVAVESDLWFQQVGNPLDCISGQTGRLDASLRLPNTFNPDNAAAATPPGFVAADKNNLIIAASEAHGDSPSESGVAVYEMDPRCRP